MSENMHKVINLQIDDVPINQLKVAEYNPRRLSDKAEADLTNSIKEFGCVDPIIINKHQDRSFVVVGGHQRLKILEKLGYKSVPTVSVNLPIEAEKELNLRLNKNTGEFDLELLRNFDIGLLLDVGFDDGDLAHIWDESLTIEDDNFDVDEAVSEIDIPRTKTGDLIKLGEHFLVCGDATDSAVIDRLLGENRINFLCYDPPYNINLNYDNGVGTKGKYGGKLTNDNKTDDEYFQFLTSAITNGLIHCKDDCHFCCWCDENYIGLVQSIYKNLGIENKRVCLWIKNNQNVTPQTAFNKAYEPCVYGVRGKPYLAPQQTNLNEVMNKEVSTGNRLTDDILDLFNIWLAKRLPANSYEHPTQKPPTVYEKALRRLTKPGDAVLDVFGGSGTTLIACEQLKRRAFLCEQEPIFCDVIIKRFQELTGKAVEYVN